MTGPHLRVDPLPAFADNYVFLLRRPGDDAVAIVDPGDAAPVLAEIERERLRPETILLTHHHADHVGGVPTLQARFPGIAVLGAARDRHRLPPLTAAVREGDTASVLGRDATVLEVPGHTTGHIAWFVPDGAGGGDLFSGDTVFGGTVGNLFECGPEEIFASLLKIRALPPATRLWAAHEYTLQYVREAARFDPGNAALAERLRRCESRGKRAVLVPLTLAEECATNPFFRWDDPALASRLGTAPGRATFLKICELL
jgi:hydroxyacylglutathione hydrolase